MDDFLTIYRQYYIWPATGRRLVRGPRPPPDPASTRAAMETMEKAEGTCSAAWTGSHESDVGVEWLRAAEELSRQPRSKDCDGACNAKQRDRIAIAKLMALMIQRQKLEDKKNTPIRRRPSKTSIYRSDYLQPGKLGANKKAVWWAKRGVGKVTHGYWTLKDPPMSGIPPAEAIWNFSDLITSSRGVDQEEVKTRPVRTTKDCGLPHCQRVRETTVEPVYLQRGCLQRSTLRSHRKTIW